MSVQISSSPPRGIASRALIARLRIAFSSWLRIDERGRHVGRKAGFDHDRLAKRAVKQLDHVGDQRLTSTGLASSGCRRENASSRCVSAAARSVPVRALTIDRCHFGSSGWERPLQQRKVSMDDLQQIVEVVGDAAGKLSDRLHLLGLAKGILGLGAAFDLFDDAAFERFVQRPQRLLGFVATLDLALRLPEQPRVVDRDCRLGGNAFHQDLVPFLEASRLRNGRKTGRR